MEERLLNKIIFYILMGILFLTACSPYGLTGNPNSNADEGKSTPEEIAAMEGMDTFPITLEEFEKNMQKQNNDAVLNVTEEGFITKDRSIQIDYKGNLASNDPLTFIYILINKPSPEFSNVQKDFIKIIEMVFISLNVSYDLNELITSINENKIEIMSTDDVKVELTNYNENIQMIISPN